ncbi:MAG: hypothetical protein AAB676_04825 [Verrucomicrobiota bacterium]
MSSVTSDPSVEIIDRGQDFAVYRSISTITNENGQASYSTNQFTLIENGLHYLEDGVWKPSEDVLEPFDGGAIARRGPNKAIFNADLNAEAVFDIEMADGKRLRGGVRAIQLTDLKTGQSVVLATVKDSAPGELLPPGQIVYRDAFDGLKADLLMAWRHNLFSHDVVLRERPELPAGWDPATVRLEVITEFVEAPVPELRRQRVGREGEEKLEDHAVIDFGAMVMLMGHGFPVEGQRAWAVGGLPPAPGATPILKQYHEWPDGRRFLVESIAWADAELQWKDLPVAKRADAAKPLQEQPEGARAFGMRRQAQRDAALAARTTSSSRTEKAVVAGAAQSAPRIWPEPRPWSSERKPIAVAQLDYAPTGYVVDFFIIPDQGSPSTFLTGWTYYIKNNYWVGSAYFQPGCTIKFKNNASLTAYAWIDFPATGTAPVFTSRNDNGFGERIIGVPGETDSNGDPTLHRASVALMVYYVGWNTEIKNARIRWAQTGVNYQDDCGAGQWHTVRDSLFEYCQTGIYMYMSCGGVVLNNVKKCTVTTPITGCCYWSGSITEDCGVVSVARVNDPAQDSASGDPNKNSQSECSFVVVDSSRIVAAFFDTHLSEYALGQIDFPGIVSPRSTGWAVSTDGGVSFTDQGALLPNPPTSTLQGDAGDPVMARDTANGAIYLLVNPSREPSTWRGFRLWKSTDNGQSFALLNSDVFGGAVTMSDKPMIAVNNYPGLSNSGHLYVAGSCLAGGAVVWCSHSADGGVTWDAPQILGPGHGADIAIRSNGTIYVFYLVSTLNGSTYQNSIQYRWRRLANNYWNGPEAVPAHPDSELLYSVNSNASGNLKRSNSAAPEDYFISNGFPRVAVNPVNGRIYLVYADLPYPGSTTNRGDIFVQDAWPHGDGSLDGHWSGAIRVNNDATQTDQWNPAVAINPAGTVLFVGYYSRQSRPTQNDLIMAYGSKANISSGLVGATFDMIPISTPFPPLFPGTTQSTPPGNVWMYDHVWVQTGVCFDVNAYLVDCGSVNKYEGPVNSPYQNFMADDYAWVSADGSYFYYAWCDRSDTYFSGGNSRPDPNIRLGKIRQ